MNKIPLIESACNDLLQYGVFDAKARIKYLVKRYLLRRRTAGGDLIFWPTGLLAAGLWHCRGEFLANEEAEDAAQRASAGTLDFADRADSVDCKKSKAAKEAEEDACRMSGLIERSLAAYYERWRKKGMPLFVIDDLLAGETLLDAYAETERTGSESCLGLTKRMLCEMLNRMADFAAKADCDRAGSILYRPGQGNSYIFVDTIGLCCPFLYRYGDLFGKPEFRELALKQITNFLAYGMDAATGLPYHGYDLSDGGCKYGIIGWGRAVGWLLRGMTGCMTSDYGRERVSAPYRALIDKALTFVRPDGYVSWQLAALDGPVDTSAVGMLCAAVKTGLALGVLAGETYENALSAGRGALERSVRNGRVNDCSGECEGFSCYPQRYGAYPWALGPALFALQADSQ